MSRLSPCPSCGRHIRVVDRACPFCGAARELAPTPARLSAALLGLCLAACSGQEAPTKPNEQPIPPPQTSAPEPDGPPEPPLEPVDTAPPEPEQPGLGHPPEQPPEQPPEPDTIDANTTAAPEQTDNAGTTDGSTADRPPTIQQDPRPKPKYGAPRPTKKYGGPPVPSEPFD